MTPEFKDYYSILGVPRTASEEDIKKAFRKLARLYHPDVAKDKKSAEAKFKEINEANEVLSNAENRRKYDELGANWNQAGRTNAHSGRAGAKPGQNGEENYEFHFGGTGFSDFFEQFFGRRGEFQGRGTPGGFDDLRGREPERGADIEGDILVSLDEILNGAIRTISLRRVDPSTGEETAHTFKVRIPAGILDGQRIRVAGQGEPGPGPASGDLYLRVRLAAHPDFQFNGTDLIGQADIAPWEAVLGATVAVKTPDGQVNIRIPPGTGAGQQLRVRGKGLPKGAGERGDLYVGLHVQLPKTVNADEKAAWEELARKSKFDPRS
jgi:curved DNA-binding protein